MAYLNDIYVCVKDENVDRKVDLPTHPTETGIDLSDHVRPKAVEISLSGVVVNNDAISAADALSQIDKWQKTGTLVTYSGRNKAWDMQIASFSSSHPNTVANGFEFDMTLQEVRFASDSYENPDTPTSVSGISSNISNLQKGDTVVFKGGAVYKSSTAIKSVANRNRSVCTVSNIAKGKAHPYHLISTDGEKVYGWVDEVNIENMPSNDTKSETSAGVQQIESDEDNVYHTVKSGETVWQLVNKTYKSLGTTCAWVISNNPSAFSKQGDAKTLIVGSRLLMGTRR
jgi:hypothetical protein